MNQSRFAVRELTAEELAVQAAMADLGVSRRDLITTEEAGNRNLNARQERAARLELRDEVDRRRATRERGMAVGDGTAAALNAWNTPTNFERDPMAAQSGDIGGGQSHRARIRGDIESGRTRDRDFDELPQHQTHPLRRTPNGANYLAVGGSQTVPEGARRTASNTTPRSHAGLQSAPIPLNNVGPPRPDGHARAPSPRASGTVRFGPGGRRTEAPPSRTNRAPSGAEEPPAVRPRLQPGVVPRATALSTASAPRTVPVADSSTPHQIAQTTSTAPRPTTPFSTTTPRTVPLTSAHATQPISQPVSAAQPAAAAQRAPSTTSTSAAAPQPQHAGLAQGAPNADTQYQPDDYIHRKFMQTKALWNAAALGDDCDRFLQSYPEAPGYLAEARRRLVNEITAIIKRYDQQEIDQYVRVHAERRWMVAAALLARGLLEEGSDDEVRAHYEKQVDHKDFFEAARIVHKSERTVSLGTMASPTVSQVPVNTTHQPAQGARDDAQTAPTAATTTSTPGAPTPPTTASVPSTRTVASTGSLTSQAAVRLNHTASLLSPGSTGEGSAVTLSQPTQRTSPVGTTQAPSSTNDTAQQSSGSVSTSSSHDSLRSANTNVTIPPPMRGTINITTFGSDGGFLGHHQVRVQAPINMNVSFTSTDTSYDPRTAYASFKEWAESNLVHHGSQTPEVSARCVEGAVQHDDGIWDEDEEL